MNKITIKDESLEFFLFEQLYIKGKVVIFELANSFRTTLHLLFESLTQTESMLGQKIRRKIPVIIRCFRTLIELFSFAD